MMERKTFVRVKVVLVGYLIAWTFGAVVGPIFWMLVAIGAIRIRGCARAHDCVEQGNVILAANHPTLIETFMIPLCFYPQLAFMPRYLLWSFPDKRFFNEVHPVIFTLLRCITVDRADGVDARRWNELAIFKATEELKRRYSIVIHPEGGRTVKRDKHVEMNGRWMGVVSSSVPRIAAATDATILPVWIEMKPWMLRGKRDIAPSIWETMARLAWPGNWPVVIHFGEQYKPEKPLNVVRERERLQRAIMSA